MESDTLLITGAMLAELKRQMRRTAVSPRKLLHGDGAAGSVFRNWMRGIPEAAPRAEVDYVLQRWRTLPDRPRLRLEPVTNVFKGPEKIPFTADIHATLRGHWLRVGLPLPAFFKSLQNPPPGLSLSIMKSWISRPPRQIRPDYLEFVLAEWEKRPSGLGQIAVIHFLPFAGEWRNHSTADSSG